MLEDYNGVIVTGRKRGFEVLVGFHYFHHTDLTAIGAKGSFARDS